MYYRTISEHLKMFTIENGSYLNLFSYEMSRGKIKINIFNTNSLNNLWSNLDAVSIEHAGSEVHYR